MLNGSEVHLLSGQFIPIPWFVIEPSDVKA